MMLKHSLRTKFLPALYRVLRVIILIFACIGFAFCAVFVGMQLDLLRVAGSVSDRNNSLSIPESSNTYARNQQTCIINLLNGYAPDTARNLYYAYENKVPGDILSQMLAYSSEAYMDDDQFQSGYTTCINNPHLAKNSKPPNRQTAFTWANSAEWATLSSALKRDRDIILSAAKDSGVPPRIIITGVIGEQFRFFAGTRTAFKNYFEPLKIFGRLSKFSYGIAGLKPETVRDIERNLLNQQSDYYLGKKYERFAHYSVTEKNQHSDPQLHRITDPDNNYYSYLYVGLYMNQIIHQWKKADYDISNKPGVLATLYNLGFHRSRPHPNPQPGGAIITVDSKRYTFGQIGNEFYYSGELIEEFPY